MPRKKKEIQTIEDLKFDAQNINKGSEFGTSLLNKSLTECGAGRSVLADKNGVLVAGNKTVEIAGQLGLSIKVVQTTGKELVVVQRTDLDINSETGTKLKILDNTVSKHNYVEDIEVATTLCQAVNLQPVELGLLQPKPDKEQKAIEPESQWALLVELDSEQACEELFNELQGKGLTVKIIT